MKKPMVPESKPTPERPQRPSDRTGVNKPMVVEPVPQIVMKNTYGKPTPSQKL